MMRRRLHTWYFFRRRELKYASLTFCLITFIVFFSSTNDARHLAPSLPLEARAPADLANLAKSLKIPKTVDATSGKLYDQVFVHFDLKGAAPTVDYFKYLLHFVAANGATGVVLEWEDMFPYTGAVKSAVNDEAYTLDQVKDILRHAKSLNLKVVPLYQTFGHLEWILKLAEFKKYRDAPRSDGVICIEDTEGVANIILDPIKQILDVQREFGIEYIHIGGDEAYEYGQCVKDSRKRDAIAAAHLASIAAFIREHSSPDVHVLAWNDMVLQMAPQDLAAVGLLQSIELVVWDYGDLARFGSFFWEANSKPDTLPIWGASAFKGADGSYNIYMDYQKRLKNNEIWRDAKKNFIPSQKFGGLIITGWQRYDHFSTFCEILPTALPSLALQLHVAKDDPKPYIRAGEALGCKTKATNLDNYKYNLRSCDFKGHEMYYAIQHTMRYLLETEIPQFLATSHEVGGWFRPYNRRYSISSHRYLGILKPELDNKLSQLEKLTTKIQKGLKKLLVGSAADEFVFDALGPSLRRFRTMVADAEAILAKDTFGKRSFKFDDTDLEPLDDGLFTFIA